MISTFIFRIVDSTPPQHPPCGPKSSGNCREGCHHAPPTPVGFSVVGFRVGIPWNFTNKKPWNPMKIPCPYAPWCWYIYLQNWVIFRANVGKYSIHGAYGMKCWWKSQGCFDFFPHIGEDPHLIIGFWMGIWEWMCPIRKNNYGFGGPCWGDPLSKYHGTIQALEKSQNNGHGNAWN